MRGNTQKAPAKNMLGRLFSSRLTTPNISFVAAVHGNKQSQSSQLPQPRHATPSKTEERASEPATTPQQGLPGQEPGTNGKSLDTIFRVATVVQQIMTELNDAVSEEDKIVTITNSFKAYE
jgi:hypothetical protein